MRNQLKGIALILFGILFVLAAISLDFAEFTIAGGILWFFNSDTIQNTVHNETAQAKVQEEQEY